MYIPKGRYPKLLMPPYFLIISNIFNRNLPNLPYLPTTHPQKVC